MDNDVKLKLVKGIHTAIWMVFVAIILFVVWSGVTSNISIYSWVAVALVLGECIVLVVFGWSCPLTKVARRYSDSTRENFDIYLPNWLARYNKQIFGTVFLVGLILMLLNYFRLL